MSSPVFEAHTEWSAMAFAFGGESTRPLTEVSFRRDNSGRDLKFYKINSEGCI